MKKILTKILERQYIKGNVAATDIKDKDYKDHIVKNKTRLDKAKELKAKNK